MAEETPDAKDGPEPEEQGAPAVRPASEAEVEAAWEDTDLAQVLYHDWESGTYDDKWSISFDDRCISFASDRFAHALGPAAADVTRPMGRALEIGAGTGFFSLNLRQAGWLDEVVVTDVSQGMVDVALGNARHLGYDDVQGAQAGITELPYPDASFDLVLGHAVLHHVPDVEAGLRECLRVLRPGGRFVFAGEPTVIGDRYARALGRATWAVTTRITHLPPLRARWARSKEELDSSSRAAALEAVVDLHTFDPGDLARTALRAGAVDVTTATEELLAAVLGWPVRTFEAAVNPDRLGWDWAMFAYKGWQRLGAVDKVLNKVLPDALFYDVSVTGVKA
ncbi:class I SAM-dependent methyltransferase [Aquipuribacter sp. MA13-6]|uniref:class I SAM-dependent methyltransferase n=1 Tax=unclassified Aquipuribacter TaxID=2635084 RepID=UPI003EE957CB